MKAVLTGMSIIAVKGFSCTCLRKFGSSWKVRQFLHDVFFLRSFMCLSARNIVKQGIKCANFSKKLHFLAWVLRQGVAENNLHAKRVHLTIKRIYSVCLFKNIL